VHCVAYFTVWATVAAVEPLKVCDLLDLTGKLQVEKVNTSCQQVAENVLGIIQVLRYFSLGIF